MAKSIKQLIDVNAVDTYKTLRKFYKEIVDGAIDDVRVLKDGTVVHVPLSAAVRIEAANALLRMDIDKVQGNAKAKEGAEESAESVDALKQLEDLARSRVK